MRVRDGKRCIVAYATRERQLLWEVDLALDASIADALTRARTLAADESIPWDDAPVGIFGELRRRTAIPQEGDRIEIYRPLLGDPRERRRRRVRQLRGSGGGSSRGG
jgi:uncharacterized protein